MTRKSSPFSLARAHQGPGFKMGPKEFIAFIAFLISLNALAIDIMLPALDDIAASLGLNSDTSPDEGPRLSDNRQQWVIFAYIAGFGAPQLIFGPLSDRFGRKPPLLGALIAYFIIAIACMFVSYLYLLLFIRFLQGIAAGAIRVIAISIVRDLYTGRAMARIISLVMAVFMIIPIMAPSIGQLILLFAPWQFIFGVLGVAGFSLFWWGALRLTETLSEEQKRPLNFRSVTQAYLLVLKTRVTCGYMLASGFIFGSLFAFIGAAEQIFREVFHRESTFTLWFAAVATFMSAANIINSRLVERFGMRLISQITLICFTSLSVLMVLLMTVFGQNFGLFFPFFALIFGCFGLIGPNFNALAMAPLGAIAGTASAAYGFTTTTLSAGIGFAIAAQYDGTSIPIITGFAGLGLISLGIIYITDKDHFLKIA